MADATFDAIVVGGGHHGTIIAAYLAKAGLDTAVFERQHELGGGACGEDLPAPGFVQNPCAHFTRFWAHPAYRDFDLPGKGLKYVFPDHNEGIVFPDGSAFIGYSALVVDPATGIETYSDENVKRTYDEIAKLSPRDAETYLELLGRYVRTWRQAFREYRYSPPTPWGVPNALEKLVGAEVDPIEPVWCFQTGRQLARDLFDSPELQILFMRAIETSTGSFPSDVLGPYVFVHTLALVLSWESASIVYGGTHSITHALQRAFSSLGGQFFVSQEVDKVVIENGRAAGVILTDGTRVNARKFVVSDLGVPQTCQRLIGEEYFTESAFRRTKKIDYDRAQIWWGNIAMHELPKYTAQAQYPDLGMQPRLYMGPKDVDYMSYKYQAEIWLNGWPSDFVLLAAPDSIYDPSRAPDGKHTILVEEFAAPYRFHSMADWRRMKKQVVGEFLKHWQKYAPNMTWDNVIDAHITTPWDVINRNIDMDEGGWVNGAMTVNQADRFRPTPELSNYRTPVNDLYICSSNLHSGGGIGRGSSYCAYKVIAEDHGLPRFWEQAGRTY
jgi:beta-carotene ketolase (CrtO type)